MEAVISEAGSVPVAAHWPWTGRVNMVAQSTLADSEQEQGLGGLTLLTAPHHLLFSSSSKVPFQNEYFQENF